jgi:hypothetical protein
MLVIVSILAIMVSCSGVYLLREKLRGKSSTSYIILSVTTTIAVSILLLNAYAIHYNSIPSSTVHLLLYSQQVFTLLGFAIIHWRMYKTFKKGFCNKAYACAVANDSKTPVPKNRIIGV